jgi:hypothetical protein
MSRNKQVTPVSDMSFIKPVWQMSLKTTCCISSLRFDAILWAEGLLLQLNIISCQFTPKWTPKIFISYGWVNVNEFNRRSQQIIGFGLEIRFGLEMRSGWGWGWSGSRPHPVGLVYISQNRQRPQWTIYFGLGPPTLCRRGPFSE